MAALIGEFTSGTASVDERGAARRTLRLEVRASSSQDSSRALIRNLSEKGLLIETSAGVAIGDTIEVDLPGTGPAAARVIWTEGAFYGCQFLQPVSRAAVSAALLRAPANEPRSITTLPALPANAPFAEDRLEAESEFQADGAAVTTAAIVSLIVMALVAAMFVYALLALSVSG